MTRVFFGGGGQWGINLTFLRITQSVDSRYVHVHTDSRCSPLRVHDRHGGDDIDQGGCQPAVQRPSTVSVLLFYPHLTHHLTGAGRQNVHLRKTRPVNVRYTVAFKRTEIHFNTVRKCRRMFIFTFFRTLSKPGLSTIALIICFNEFIDSETIFNANKYSQCQTSVYFVPGNYCVR